MSLPFLSYMNAVNGSLAPAEGSAGPPAPPSPAPPPADYLAQVNAAMGPPRPAAAPYNPLVGEAVDARFRPYVSKVKDAIGSAVNRTVDRAAAAAPTLDTVLGHISPQDALAATRRFGSSPAAAAPPPVAETPAAGPASPAGPPPVAPDSSEAAPDVQAQPFPLVATGGGGVIAAHEQERRGPSLLRAQNESNAVADNAIHNIAQRSEATAAVEAEAAHAQAQAAFARQDATNVAAAERDQELQQRQQDFDASVKSLSKLAAQPDGGFYASRSTGQKIGMMLSIALGGFVQGARGGNNPGLDIINTAIDRDIKAQEFAYKAALDSTNAKQTAFSLAMSKYQNEDVARAAVRAAAIDAVQAQAAESAATWKGTDAANNADQMMSKLAEFRAQQVQQGVAFIPATQVGRTFIDPRTGLRYSEQEAKAMATEMRGQEFKREEVGLNAAKDVLVNSAKTQAERNKDLEARQVRLPNGEVVTARTAEEQKGLSEASASVIQTQQLIARAKQLRQESLTGKALTPSARAEMAGIRADLLTNYGVQHHLGALSDSDYDQALAGTGGDLLSLNPGTMTALDSAQRRAEDRLTSMVKTNPGTSRTARGEMPESFKPGWKLK